MRLSLLAEPSTELVLPRLAPSLTSAPGVCPRSGQPGRTEEGHDHELAFRTPPALYQVLADDGDGPRVLPGDRASPCGRRDAHRGNGCRLERLRGVHRGPHRTRVLVLAPQPRRRRPAWHDHGRGRGPDLTVARQRLPARHPARRPARPPATPARAWTAPGRRAGSASPQPRNGLAGPLYPDDPHKDRDRDLRHGAPRRVSAPRT